MEDLGLTVFDMGVLGVIALSALLSFYRGFLREIMSLGSWITAAIVTLYAFPHVSTLIEPEVGSKEIASGLASLGVFMVSLITIVIISGIILKYLKPGDEIGFLDNALGLMFGVLRGVLIVAVAYFMTTLVVTEKDYPDFMKEAFTRPYVAEASDFVARIAPGYLQTIAESTRREDALVPKALPTVKPVEQQVYHPKEPTIDEVKKRWQEMEDKQGQ